MHTAAVNLPHNYGLAVTYHLTHILHRHGAGCGTARVLVEGHPNSVHSGGGGHALDSRLAVIGIEVAPGLTSCCLGLGEEAGVGVVFTVAVTVDFYDGAGGKITALNRLKQHALALAVFRFNEQNGVAVNGIDRIQCLIQCRNQLQRGAFTEGFTHVHVYAAQPHVGIVAHYHI